MAVFSFVGIKVLVPGDNEPPSWNELKDMDRFWNEAKDIDVLPAPPHGRESDFDSDTVKQFPPRLTIVSDGAYHHTSATNRYTAVSRDWTVYKKDGANEKRFCVTTRNDGAVKVTFGKGTEATRSFTSR